MERWDEVRTLLNERDEIYTQLESACAHLDPEQYDELHALETRIVQLLRQKQHDTVRDLRSEQKNAQIRRAYRQAG
jgi:predicted transcriptional regulator